MRTLPPRAVGILLASLAAIASARAAFAQQPKTAPPRPPHGADDLSRARALDQQGARAYTDGHYNDAIRYFEDAYRLGGPPFELWNVAKCHLRLDQPEQAAEVLERYLATPDLPPDDRAEATAQLDELKKRPSTLTVSSSPAGAAVSIDGKPEPMKTPFSVSVAPGAHDVSVALPNHAPYTKRVEARYGRAIILDASLAQDDQPPPPPPPPPPKPPRAPDDSQSRRVAMRADLGVVFPRFGSVDGDTSAGFFASGTYRLSEGSTWLAVGLLFFASGDSWRNSINAPTTVNGCGVGLRDANSATALSLYGIGTAGWEIVPRLRVAALAGLGVAGYLSGDLGGDAFLPSCTTAPGARPSLLVGAQVDYAVTSAFRLSALPLTLQLQPAFAGTRTNPVDASGLWLRASIAFGVGVDL